MKVSTILVTCVLAAASCGAAVDVSSSEGPTTLALFDQTPSTITVQSDGTTLLVWSNVADMLTGAGYRIQKTLYQPYTNLCMSLQNNVCRNTGTSKQDALSHFDQSEEALLFFARMFGVPTTDMKKFSYSMLFEAQKI